MSENKFDIKDTSLAVDINEATQAVKENRFDDALNLLKIKQKMILISLFIEKIIEKEICFYWRYRLN